MTVAKEVASQPILLCLSVAYHHFFYKGTFCGIVVASEVRLLAGIRGVSVFYIWVQRRALVCSRLIMICFGPSAGYDENYTMGKAAGKYSKLLIAKFRNWIIGAPLSVLLRK